MSARTQQLFASIAFGGAVATAFAIVAPQLLAVQSAPAVAEVAPVVEVTPADEVPATDETALDMNHWQETGGPVVSPFTTGASRKK